MSDLWDYDDDCASEEAEKPALPPVKKKMCASLLSDSDSPQKKAASCDSSSSSGSYTPVARAKRKAQSELLQPAKAQKSEHGARVEPQFNEVARMQQIELAQMMNDFFETIHEVEQASGDEVSEKGEANTSTQDEEGSNPTPDDDSKTKSEPDASKKIILVCQDSKQRTVKVRLGLDEGFESLFARYKKHAISQGWVQETDKLQFRFDDEVVSSTDTPQDLECEHHDRLDVFVAQFG